MKVSILFHSSFLAKKIYTHFYSTLSKIVARILSLNPISAIRFGVMNIPYSFLVKIWKQWLFSLFHFCLFLNVSFSTKVVFFYYNSVSKHGIYYSFSFFALNLSLILIADITYLYIIPDLTYVSYECAITVLLRNNRNKASGTFSSRSEQNYSFFVFAWAIDFLKCYVWLGNFDIDTISKHIPFSYFRMRYYTQQLSTKRKIINLTS